MLRLSFVFVFVVPLLIPSKGWAEKPGNVLPERVYRYGISLHRPVLTGGVVRERDRVPKALPTASFDYLTMEQDMTLDPATGQVSATIRLTVRAQDPTAPFFYVLVDEGLAYTDATAVGYTVNIDDLISPPYNYATLTLSPPAAVGQEVTVTFRYSGTLQCNPSGPREHRGCGYGVAMNHFMDGAAFPLIMDGAEPYGHDTLTRTLTLRTPSGSDVLVSADPVDSTDDGTTLTTRWQADNYVIQMYFVALTGDFDMEPVTGTAPPFEVAHLADSTDWVTDMAGWISDIVPYLDDQSGMAFPFDRVTVVKLPWIPGFPGTATHSMVYLSEVYGTRSAEEFEETLAHEICHLWWGVLVNPIDISLMLVEGMAVLTQYDYTWARYYSGEDRDRHLGERYVWNLLLLRYLTDPETLEDLVLPPGSNWPSGLNESVTWAYFKSSAVLDYLRVIVGDSAFADGLRGYRAACLYQPCTTQDFVDAVEVASGQDLTTFFDQFVYDTHYPNVDVGFIQTEVSGTGQWEVTVDITQDVDIVLPLELWLNLVDGQTVRETVTLTGASADFSFTVDAQVLSVQPNPRQDAVVWSRSVQPADPDFTMDVDGMDLIRCARRFGVSAISRDATDPTIRDVDLNFDPRCDMNDDAVIDDTDLDFMQANFGVGVTS